MSAPDRKMLASVAAKQAVKRLIQVLAADSMPDGKWLDIDECIIDTDMQTVTFSYGFTKYFENDFPEDENAH